MKNIYLSKSEIEFQIENGKPLILKDHKVLREYEEYSINVLETFLKYIGKEKIFDNLAYCLRELINNAKKANTKRVFFMEENLDINNIEDYEKGMKRFKEVTIPNIEHYLELQEKNNLFVQLYFQIKDPFLNIIISNNSPILEQEKAKIISKITHAKTFNSVEEAFQNVLDDSEGAGLGIVILILILRKIGVYDKNFAIVTENDMTHVRLAIPLSLVTEEEVDMISDALIKEIDSIPQFPDNIRILSGMIENKDVDFKAVAEIIKKDPALTMEILKMANSAHYRRLNKIEKIDLAVSIIGVKGVKYLLHSYGVKKAMEEKYSYKELQKIWLHSYQVAQISSIICDLLNKTDLGEQAYVGGLLHDIGKIVIKSLHPETMDKIGGYCMKKNISVNIIENLLDGANHFQIGSKMALKWGLPPNLVLIIRDQSNPYAPEEETKDVTKIIYLANVISSLLTDDEPEYLSYQELILNEFKLDTDEKLQKFLTLIRQRLVASKL